MEGLQLHTHLVDPRATTLQRRRVIQLRIKRQHVQLDFLPVNSFLRIQHILNQLTIRRSGRMNTNDALRLILTLLIRRLFLLILLIAVQRCLASLIRRGYGL